MAGPADYGRGGGQRRSPAPSVKLIWAPESGVEADVYKPPVDVYENEDSVLMELELPGVKKESIQVSVTRNVVRVEGIKGDISVSVYKEAGRVSFHQFERKFGKFFREIELPVPCNTKEARAWHDKGILTIEVKKIKERRGEVRRIPVE